MRFGGLQLAANRSTAQFLTKNVAIAPSPTAPFSNNQQPTTMTTIRPIDEELTRLHHPVITEGDDMDAYDVSLLRCSAAVRLHHSYKHII
jgi:hypothetical protein